MDFFKNAVPVWIKNKRTVQNYQAGFRCNFNADENSQYRLVLTGATLYRIFLNGEFIGYGPARAGHGYLRCDEIILNVKNGLNRLAVEVAGYNCPSYYTMDIKSFLCAEVFEDGNSIAYTGKDFNGLGLDKLRNVFSHRYSTQRAYGEVWNFDSNTELYNWTTSDNLDWAPLMKCTVEEEFIERGVPNPKYNIDRSSTLCEKGNLIHKNPDELVLSRYYNEISNMRQGYLLEDLTCVPIREIYGDFVPKGKADTSDEYVISDDEYVMFNLEHDNTGFIISDITALEDSDVYLFFAEHRYDGGMVFKSVFGTTNIVKYSLKKSDIPYNMETFESYTFKYIGIVVTKGKVALRKPAMREYSYPDFNNTSFNSGKPNLNKIFAAALTTYAQNTLDIFMDCPGRERGGWLCDSYFIAQSERMFSGNSRVEKNFLENFVMAKEFPGLDAGLLPMVYPSGACAYTETGFIPQWALWFFVELEHRYKTREEFSVEEYKDLAYGLLSWYEQFENSDGLLEHIPGWNLLEWSAAQEWFNDVNYPTNMLYYKFINIVGELFADETVKEKASHIKDEIIKQSFNGEFFVENAVRNSNGELVPTENISETCQYFAYFCNIISFDDADYKAHRDAVVNVLGSNPMKNVKYPDMVPSAAFIGNYMRIELLLGIGEYKVVLDDVERFFLKMAETTGTLWENADFGNEIWGESLDHGFASCAGVYLVMACAGIRKINYKDRVVFADKDYLCGFDYNVSIGTPDGNINISVNNGVKNIDLPKNWSISL